MNPPIVMSWWWTLIADIGGWLIIQWGSASLFSRMPDHWFETSDSSRHVTIGKQRESAFSASEASFYERILRVRSWKDRLPDGSRALKHGFNKSRIAGRDPNYLYRYVRETKRGEWAHYAQMVPAPVFFLWNEALFGWIMMFYAIVVNVPCIIALRYNRHRLSRVVLKLKEKSES